MKKNLDWENIGFAYRPTDSRFVSMYTDGKWDEGAMTDDPNVTISESSGVFQYAQTCFEGMKAYTTEDGHTVIFRPDLNAERMMTSCERLCLPVYPKEKFVDAVVRTVRANLDWVPPYGSGASLYIRPFMIGYSPVLGVSAAKDAMFRVFVSPVGPYFKGGIRPLKLKVSEYDRAAPRGTGDVKAGLNYAMSLHAIEQAHHESYDENMYLDSATRTKIEETGGANFLFVTRDGTVVTPKSPTILPLDHAAFADGRRKGLPRPKVRGARGSVRRAAGDGRVRPVRHGSSHLAGRQRGRRRPDVHVRHQRGQHGSDRPQALRNTHRHPDGPYSGT